MPEEDTSKKADQIAMLEHCRRYTDGGEWRGMFSYPACGRDLVRSGLVEEGGKITISGRAALWFLGKGDDPTPDSKSFEVFKLPPRERAAS